jgi:hypothetical protein
MCDLAIEDDTEQALTGTGQPRLCEQGMRAVPARDGGRELGGVGADAGGAASETAAVFGDGKRRLEDDREAVDRQAVASHSHTEASSSGMTATAPRRRATSTSSAAAAAASRSGAVIASIATRRSRRSGGRLPRGANAVTWRPAASMLAAASGAASAHALPIRIGPRGAATAGAGACPFSAMFSAIA